MLDAEENIAEKIKMDEARGPINGLASDSQDGPQRQTFVEKLKHGISLITVEPILLFYIMPAMLANIAIQKFYLEKACRVSLNYPLEICTNITANEKLLNKVHEQYISMTAWKVPLNTALPGIIILFVGAWSDRTGRRKPCMIVPLFGEFVAVLCLLLSTYYFLEWSLELTAVLETLPAAVVGSYQSIVLGVFSYLADITTTENRTFRIGILNTGLSLTLAGAQALSGTLYNAVGYYGVFGMSLGFYVFCVLYGMLRIKEKKRTPETKDSNVNNGNFCVMFFNWRHVLDTFNIIFKKRKSNRRLQVILVILCHAGLIGPINGIVSNQFSYFTKTFEMTEVEYSIFTGYSTIVSSFGVLLAMFVLSKYLKLNDNILGAIACVSKMIGYFVYAFVPSKGWLYLGPVIDLIGNTAPIVVRSMGTKVVDEDEIGKISCVFGVAEAVVIATYVPLLSKVYEHYLDTSPEAFCILGGLLIVPVGAIFLWIYKLQKSEEAESTSKDLNIEMKDNPAFESEISHM